MLIHNNNRTTMMMSLLPLLFTIVGCFASKDKIDSDKIHSEDVHQSYDIYFDANTNTTSFYATFRLGGSTGTTVELVQPGKLEINNQAAIVDHTYGAHYSSKLRTGNQQVLTITWSTNEGEKYINTFNMLPVSTNSSFSGSLPLQSNSSIGIDASDFEASTENIRLEISQVTVNGTYHTASVGTYDPASQQLIINSNELQNLKPGPATFGLSRSSFKQLQQQTPIGGNAYLKYYKSFSGQLTN